MNKIVAAVLCLSGFAVFAEGTDESSTVAFYDFKDGEAGAYVYEIKNVVDETLYTGTAKPTATTPAGQQPRLSSDRPGKYVYDGVGMKTLLVTDPQSVHFYPTTNDAGTVATETGGYVSIADLATKMSEFEEGTIEFFGKMDAFQTWRNFVTFNAGQSYKICISAYNFQVAFQNYWKYNVAGSVGYYNFTTLQGVWHHYALTWSKRDNVAYYYCDYKYGGTTYLTNSVQTTSKPVILGASLGCNGEALAGKVSCLRVSSKILSPEEMLQVSNFNPKSEQLGFWDFNDGEAGETVNTIENKANPVFANGVAKTYNNGDPSTFIDDVPAPYILKSTREPVLLAENHKSIHFTGDQSSSSKGSGISLVGLAEALAQMPSWTVEFFARRSEDFTATWRTAFSLNISENGAQGLKLSLPAGNITDINLQEQRYNHDFRSEIAAQGYDTSVWRHYAVTFTNNQARLFVDYNQMSQSRMHHKEYITNWVDGVEGGEVASVTTNSVYMITDFVAMTNVLTGINYNDVYLGSGFRGSGYEQFNGDISCVRVSPRILDNDEFMVASYVKPGDTNVVFYESTVFHWRGEGAAGTDVTADPPYPFGANYLVAYSVAAIAGSSKCKYSTSAINSSRPFVWYGDEKTRYVNTSCIEFFGCDGETHTHSWDGSVLQNLKTTVANVHPESWTMETFIKARLDVPQYYSSLVFGKGISDNNWTWKLAVENNYTRFFISYYPENEDGSKGSEVVVSLPDKDIKDGKWHHVAMSYDAQTYTFKVYIDYELALTKVETRPLYDDTSYVYRLGRYCGERGFCGWMDEIRFSGRVLKSDEFIRLLPEEGMTLFLR